MHLNSNSANYNEKTGQNSLGIYLILSLGLFNILSMILISPFSILSVKFLFSLFYSSSFKELLEGIALLLLL